MEAKKIWIQLYTITRREVARFLRIWTQTLLPPVINQSLYFIIFGGFIGSQIKSIQGISYMAFIVPGLVMMAVISNSFANVVSSFFGSKFQRNIEELIVSPSSPSVILAGYCMGGVLRGILTGGIIFLVSVFFIHPVVLHPVIIALFVVLASIVFSLGGIINAIFATKFDDIGIFPTFVMTPLTYFGGVFYSIKNLSPFWQSISKWNPILYMVDGFRYGFYGISDVNIKISAGILVGLAVILTVIALRLLEKGTGLKN